LKLRSAASLLLVGVSLLVGLPPAGSTETQTFEVQIGDNFFDPQEIRIDVGDTVVWDGGGVRPHTVTSDEDLFDSGRMQASDEFEFTFEKKGSFYYHCTLHGNPQRGMYGVVMVGPPKVDKRPKLVVPTDYPTIQAAVDHARKGTLIVVRPGTYEESVAVVVPRLTIKGVDRYRTVMDGGDLLPTGVSVTGNKVAIKNMTVRNYTDDGIVFDHVSGYTVARVDSIKNRRFGVRATNSYDGVIRQSFGWGSGDAPFHVESCFGCGALIENVLSETNFAGFSSINATGLTVRDSTFADNGVGVLLTSFSAQPFGSGRGALLYRNAMTSNNYTTIPPAGLSTTYGLPFGTGVWLAGVTNSEVIANEVAAHDAFGVLISDDLTGEQSSVNNRIAGNTIGGSAMFEMAWDGTGSSNCFEGNSLAGGTGPAGLQDAYPCSSRPFPGTLYEPVAQAVDTAIAAGAGRPWEEPPEPDRPSCQKGAPGCDR
jgi:plastocyanin